MFLRGCGLADWEIAAAKLYDTDLTTEQVTDIQYEVFRLRTDKALQFRSCFISYSSVDEELASKLQEGLQEAGARCWFAPEDMKTGDRIRSTIDESIRVHDKLLLILSAASIESQWVEQEVETALAREREHGETVLFPIRVDEAPMEIESGWPQLIRNTRHIGDFRGWDDEVKWEPAFQRLLQDLRVH